MNRERLTVASLLDGLVPVEQDRNPLQQDANLSVVPIFVAQATICSPALVELNEYAALLTETRRWRMQPILVMPERDRKLAEMLWHGAAIDFPIYFDPSEAVARALFSYGDRRIHQQLVFYSPSAERVLGRLVISNVLTETEEKILQIESILEQGDQR